MCVVLLSTDLMFAPRVSSVARTLGGACRMVSPSQLDEALNADTRLVLVDLNMPGVDAKQLVDRVRAVASHAGVVAFGQHVHEGRLEAAQQAGCDQVVTRGELHGRLPDILGKWLGNR